MATRDWVKIYQLQQEEARVRWGVVSTPTAQRAAYPAATWQFAYRVVAYWVDNGKRLEPSVVWSLLGPITGYFSTKEGDVLGRKKDWGRLNALQMKLFWTKGSTAKLPEAMLTEFWDTVAAAMLHFRYYAEAPTHWATAVATLKDALKPDTPWLTYAFYALIGMTIYNTFIRKR